MYAIVRNKDGTYYTSMVFGYFCKMTETDDYKRYLESIHNQFYLVLNEAKDCLIKKYFFPKENKYLDPQILIVDTEQKDWILDEEHHGCASFLCGVDFDADELEVDPSILGKCIAMDTMQSYQEIVEVKSEADIENLCCVSGCFHDAYIKKCERLGDKSMFYSTEFGAAKSRCGLREMRTSALIAVIQNTTIPHGTIQRYSGTMAISIWLTNAI